MIHCHFGSTVEAREWQDESSSRLAWRQNSSHRAGDSEEGEGMQAAWTDSSLDERCVSLEIKCDRECMEMEEIREGP